MKPTKGKIIKPILSFLVLILIFSSAFVSALDVNLEEPNDVKRGRDIDFKIKIGLSEEEKYFFERDDFLIKYT